MGFKDLFSKLFKRPTFTAKEDLKPLVPAGYTPLPVKTDIPVKQVSVPKPYITGKQLKAICGALDGYRADKLASYISELAPRYNLDRSHLPAFLAQVAHESGCFSSYTENLNYRPDSLKSIFGFYKRNPDLAEKHGRTAQHKADQVAIANHAYADKNRPKHLRLGNIYEGDGWKYRGVGPIQSTGREILTKYAKYKGIGVDVVVDLIRTDDKWAIDNALWVYTVEKGLPGNRTFEQITAKINAAKDGLDKRKMFYERALKALKN